MSATFLPSNGHLSNVPQKLHHRNSDGRCHSDNQQDKHTAQPIHVQLIAGLGLGRTIAGLAAPPQFLHLVQFALLLQLEQGSVDVRPVW